MVNSGNPDLALWRFTTVRCFYIQDVQVQQNMGSSSPRYFSKYRSSDNPDLAYWRFTTVGCFYLQVQQNKGSSSPRHIFYVQKHWRFITVCCFFLQVQQNKGSSSPRHISTYFSTNIDTVTIQIWLIGGLLLLAVSTSSPFYCTQTQKQPTLVNRQ